MTPSAPLTLSERCDEIVRLIDETLADVDTGGEPDGEPATAAADGPGEAIGAPASSAPAS